MIKYKGLEFFFIEDDQRLLDKKQRPKINRILDLLDIINDVRELNLPGYGLHPLTGNRKGKWSVKVNGNWRYV
jgi:proteic killer suppression protein